MFSYIIIHSLSLSLSPSLSVATPDNPNISYLISRSVSLSHLGGYPRVPERIKGGPR